MKYVITKLECNTLVDFLEVIVLKVEESIEKAKEYIECYAHYHYKEDYWQVEDSNVCLKLVNKNDICNFVELEYHEVSI